MAGNTEECGLLAIGPSMSWPHTQFCHSLPSSCLPFTTLPPCLLSLLHSAMGAFFVCRKEWVAVMWWSMGSGHCCWLALVWHRSCHACRPMERVVKAVGGQVVSWDLLVK